MTVFFALNHLVQGFFVLLAAHVSKRCVTGVRPAEGKT